jgi:hypothetical protein
MPTTLASTNIQGVQLKNGAAPATPAAGFVRLYTSAAKALHHIDDAGLDLDLTKARDLIGGTVSGDYVWADKVLSRAELKDYAETNTAPAIAANVLTLDLELGNVFSVALNAAITTLTISNPPASGKAGSFSVLFTADGTVRAITWPASVKWSNGAAPTMTGTNGKVDIVSMLTVDGGTTWYANILQNF